jgi:hypothetical protein
MQTRSPIESAVRRHAAGTPFHPQVPSVGISLDDIKDTSLGKRMTAREMLEEEHYVDDEKEGDHFKSQRTTSTDEDGSCVRLAKMVDCYSVIPRPPSTAGGAITIMFFAVAATVAALMYVSLMNAPHKYEVDVTWSAIHAPFPMTLRCVSTSGCLVSSADQDGTITACTTLAAGDETTLDLYSFNSPLALVSVLARDPGNYSAVASLLSQVYMHQSSSADADGTVLIYHDVVPGNLFLTHVFTHNKTLSGSGRERHEYFQLQTDFASAALASTTTCALDGGGLWDGSTTAQARIRLQPQTTFVTVTEAFNPFSWLGESSGIAAGILGLGSSVVSMVEFLGLI